MILKAIMAILLATTSSQEGSEMSDYTVPVFDVQVDELYGALPCRWKLPEDIPSDENLIIIQIMTDSGPQDGPQFHSFGSFITGIDYLGYYCQEYGIPDQLRFCIRALNNGTVVAEGISPWIDPSQYYPDQEELKIGTDFNREDINGFDYDGNADYAEGNFSYSIHAKGNDFILNANFFDSHGSHLEKSVKLSQGQWNRLLDIIAEGRITRITLRDPDIEMLDGSMESMKISWKGMTGKQQIFYRLSISEPQKQQISKLLDECLTSAGSSLLSGIIASSIAVASAVLLLIKRKRK